MNVICSTSPFPHVLIQNYYSDQELNDVWKELNALSKFAKPPNMTGSATDSTGKSLKENLGIFLSDVYFLPAVSAIFNANRKVFDARLMKELGDNVFLFKYLTNTNWDNTLVQFYLNEHHYKPHNDTALFTLVTNIHSVPKKYTGGVLRFTEYDYTIELKNNESILFPSVLMHEVTPVKSETDNLLESRITVTTLIGISWTNNKSA